MSAETCFASPRTTVSSQNVAALGCLHWKATLAKSTFKMGSHRCGVPNIMTIYSLLILIETHLLLGWLVIESRGRPSCRMCVCVCVWSRREATFDLCDFCLKAMRAAICNIHIQPICSHTRLQMASCCHLNMNMNIPCAAIYPGWHGKISMKLWHLEAALSSWNPAYRRSWARGRARPRTLSWLSR